MTVTLWPEYEIDGTLTPEFSSADQVRILRTPSDTFVLNLLPYLQGNPGPQGPVGPSGGFMRHDQLAPAATWIIAHTFGRVPNVGVYLPSGERVWTDFVASDTGVTVTFPSAETGFAILT